MSIPSSGIRCRLHHVLVAVAMLLLLVHVQPTVSQELRLICNNTGLEASNFYVMRPNSGYCYRYFQSDKNYFDANRTCFRTNGLLARIDSQSENEYIYQMYFLGGGQRPFWIGMDDQDQEGVFKWIEGNKLLNTDTYKNWSDGSPVDNTQSRDCVQFSVDGWRVHIGFCETSNLPFLCRQQACNSTNGVSCVVPVPEPFPIGIIIAIVLIVLVIAVVVIVILVLLWLWKYRNDSFYRYVCCCLHGRANEKVRSLQQENQRLRHELSQQKLGLSGRFSQGQLTRQLSNSAVSPTRVVSPTFPIPEEPRPGTTGPPLMHTLSTSRFAPAPIRSPSIGSTLTPMTSTGMLGASLYSRQPMQRNYSFGSNAPFSLNRPMMPQRTSIQTIPEQKTLPSLGRGGPLPPTKSDRPASGTSQSSSASSTTSATSSKIGEEAKE